VSRHAIAWQASPEDPWIFERYAPPITHRAADRAPVILPAPARSGRRALVAVLVVLLGLPLAGLVLAAPILREYPATLSHPDAAAGMTRLTDPAHVQAADRIRAHIAAGVRLDDLTVDVYAADTDPGRPVLVAAGTHLFLNPGGQLDAAFRTFATTQYPVTDSARVYPGFLGGAARCGTDVALAMTVCAWADHGSVGFVYAYDRDVEDTADLMREMRAELVHRY